MYHQVNIEIGEFTKIYTYSYPHGKSNDSIKQTKANDLRFDLDEVAYFMGMPLNEWRTSKTELLSTRNFRGCLNLIKFNKKEIALHKFEATSFPGSSFVGSLILGCNILAPTFLKSFTSVGDSLQIKYPVSTETFLLEMYLKTYVQTGIIVKYALPRKPFPLILLYLKDNEFRLVGNLTSTVSFALSHSDKNNDDGTWHLIRIEVNDLYALLSVDTNTIKFSFNDKISLVLPVELSFGGSFEDTPGIIGCLKDIFVSRLNTPIRLFLNESLNVTYEENACSMNDLCFPDNPCKNGGHCIQSWKEIYCDCKLTGYSGAYCEVKDKVQYQLSCSSYYQIGYRQDGIYFIKPGSNAPFPVKCIMNSFEGKGTTIIETVSKSSFFIFTGTTFDDKFYYHSISYRASKQQIVDLIAASGQCRQYVRYNCYESTLMNSKEPSTQLGVRWFSRKGELKNYWAGGKNNSLACRCAGNKTCANPSLKCNCDIMDKQMRFDDGFYTEKNELPISKIKVSVAHSNHRSSFEIGPLECVGSMRELDSEKEMNKLTTHSSPVPNNHFNTTVTFTSRIDLTSNQTPLEVITKLINTTSKTIREQETLIVINTKLLYAIIITIGTVVILIIMLFIVKRWWFSSSYGNARPHIIQLYKEEEISHNNKRNNVQISNDIKLTVDHIDMTPCRRLPSYRQSSCESSSRSDKEYYYDESLDNFNMHDEPERECYPKKRILKIKKDLLLSQPVKRGSHHSGCTSYRQKSLNSEHQLGFHCQDSSSSSDDTEISELKGSQFYNVLNSECKTVTFSTENVEESFLYGEEYVQTLV